VQRVRRVHGLDEAQAHALVGVDPASGHQQLLGLVQADRAREHVDRRHVGQHADAQEHHAERRARRGEDEVGAQREREAAAPRRAVDRRDHRQLQVAQRLQPRVQGLDPPAHARDLRAVGQASLHRLHVAAAAERAAAAREHERARAARLHLRDHLRVVVAQRHRQRVADLAAQVLEHRDAVGVHEQARFAIVEDPERRSQTSFDRGGRRVHGVLHPDSAPSSA